MVKILEPVLVLAKEDPVRTGGGKKKGGVRERGCFVNEEFVGRLTPLLHFAYLCSPFFSPNLYTKEFKGITKWVLPNEEEAEEVAPIMEGIIKVKLGIDDQDDDEEEE